MKEVLKIINVAIMAMLIVFILKCLAACWVIHRDSGKQRAIDNLVEKILENKKKRDASKREHLQTPDTNQLVRKQ